MTLIASFRATDIYAVTIEASPRTFPRRSTDYKVSVIDYTGASHSTATLGSEKVARQLANTAWVALRNGASPKQIWG